MHVRRPESGARKRSQTAGSLEAHVVETGQSTARFSLLGWKGAGGPRGPPAPRHVGLPATMRTRPATGAPLPAALGASGAQTSGARTARAIAASPVHGRSWRRRASVARSSRDSRAGRRPPGRSSEGAPWVRAEGWLKGAPQGIMASIHPNSARLRAKIQRGARPPGFIWVGSTMIHPSRCAERPHESRRMPIATRGRSGGRRTRPRGHPRCGHSIRSGSPRPGLVPHPSEVMTSPWWRYFDSRSVPELL
jgi:hypothetical protein